MLDGRMVNGGMLDVRWWNGGMMRERVMVI
jgi:hypothetical protein